MYKRFPKPQTLNPSRKEQTASCSSLRTRKRKPHCTRPHTTVPGCGLQGLLLVTMLTSVTIVTFTPLINVSTIASIAAIASITTITVITIYYMLFVLLQISQCWYCLLRCVYIYIYIYTYYTHTYWFHCVQHLRLRDVVTTWNRRLTQALQHCTSSSQLRMRGPGARPQ